MPCTPIAERASRTSSSLNGLMMAVTSFMVVSPPLSEFVEVFERDRRLRPGGGHAVGAQEGVLVGLVVASLEAQLQRLDGHPGDSDRALLPLLLHAGAVALLVVEVLPAQGHAPLVVDLVVGVG